MTMTQPGLSEATAANDRTYKILSILSLCFLIFSVTLLWNNPILHYDLSPYSGTPTIAWIFLFISFFLAGYVLLSSQMVKTTSANRWFLIGLFMIILVAAVVLLFPYIRGAWFMDKADQISHVSATGLLLTTGYSTSYYPPLHVLSSNLIMITGISPYDTISLLGILIYLLSIIGIYCLATVVLKDRRMVALAVIAAATFPPGRVSTIPYYLSIMLLPLVISFYLTRHKSTSHMVVCLILIALMVFFHPLTALILIPCLIGIELSIKLYQRYRKTRANRSVVKQPGTIRGGYNTILLYSIGFLVWMIYANFNLFSGQVERLVEAITSPIQLTKFQHFIVDFPTLGIVGGEFAELFLKMYGHNVIFLLLTVIAVFLVYRKIRSRMAQDREVMLFYLSSWMVLTGAVLVIALVRPSGFIFSIPRLTFILTVMTPIFVAYALYYSYIYISDRIVLRFHLTGERAKKSLLMLPLAVLSIAFIIMTFMIYPSTHIRQSNLQLMKAEIAGASWLLEHTNLREDVEAYDLGINWRLMEVSAILAGYYPESDHPYTLYRKLTKRLPDHMGYESYSTMGEYFGSIQLPREAGFQLLDDGYVTLTTERTRRALELYLELGWLNQNDLDKFYGDKTINKIYVNYEYSTYWVPLEPQ